MTHRVDYLGISMMLAALSALSLACASAPPLAPVTPAQRAWFSQRDAQPPQFIIEKSKADRDWSRAKAWIVRCSEFKLQIVDADVLETYNPPNEVDVRFGYSVTREMLDDGNWRFTVKAASGNEFAGKLADSMAKSLSYYIVTGKDCPDCPCGRRHQAAP